MGVLCFDKADAIHQQEKALQAMKVSDAASCAEYFKGYFEYIYNHKMFGGVYNIYDDAIKVVRENGMVLEGIPEVELEIIRMNAAFPDLTIQIEDAFAVENGKDAYKIWMRYYFHGTNNGISAYGPPTGLRLQDDQALNLSAYYVEKVAGEWLIVHEMTARPEDYLRYICTGDKSFSALLNMRQ